MSREYKENSRRHSSYSTSVIQEQSSERKNSFAVVVLIVVVGFVLVFVIALAVAVPRELHWRRETRARR